jgi:hypothetical protein
MTPAHMASPDLVVVCGDGTVHGNHTFDDAASARRWADQLSCPGRHRFAREGVLVLTTRAVQSSGGGS